MRKERLEDIKLEKVLGSYMCQYSVIENKLQILYKNQEQILKAIKLLNNQNEETPEEELSPEEALIKWCEETSKNKETIEQQAEIYANRWFDGKEAYYGFIEGAKWQHKQICEHDYILTTEQGHRVIKCCKCNNTQSI